MSSVSFRSGLVVSLATRLFPVLVTRRRAHLGCPAGARRGAGPRAAARPRRRPPAAAGRAPDAEPGARHRRGRVHGGARLRPPRPPRLEARPALAARPTCSPPRPPASRPWRSSAGLALGAFRFRFFPLLDDPWSALLDPLWLDRRRSAGCSPASPCRSPWSRDGAASQLSSDVTYTYPGGGAPALRNVTLQFGAAEVVLVLGGSGSGKSTLLRALNGLVPHFHGGSFAGRVLVGRQGHPQHAPQGPRRHRRPGLPGPREPGRDDHGRTRDRLRPREPRHGRPR